MDERTVAQVIKQINAATTEQALRIEAQRKGLIKVDADTEAVKTQIEKLYNDMDIDWEGMSVKQRDVAVREIVGELQKQTTEFNTSTPMQIKQWTDLIMDVLSGMPIMKSKTGAGFKMPKKP